MKKASTALFITMILSVISGCGHMDLTESNSSHKRYNCALTVWYVDDQSDLWTNYQNLVSEYNETNGKEQAVTISSRSFSDDSSLVHELMDAERPPSVVLCSGEAAAYLDHIGIPHSTNNSFQQWHLAHFDQDFLSCGISDRGRFSVPIAISPDILIVNNQLVSSAKCYSSECLSTLEGVNTTAFNYRNETGTPFFTAESFSRIIRNTMAARGEDFHGKREVDIASENFKYAYNILAQIAFHQSLILSEEDASRLVLNGDVPCAIVQSESLMKSASDADADICTILPYPYLENGEKVYCLHSCSAMITGNKENEQYAAAEFLSWLCGSGDRLTEDTGYFPAYAVSDGETHTGRIKGDSAIYRLIADAFSQMEKTGHPYYSGNMPEFYENSQAFEQDYRKRLSNLLDS